MDKDPKEYLKDLKKDLKKDYNFKTISRQDREPLKLLTEEELKFLKVLIGSHVMNVSCICPRKIVVEGHCGMRTISAVKWSIYIGEPVMAEGSHVRVKTENITIFCKNNRDIVAIAKNSYDIKSNKDCFSVSILEKPLEYTGILEQTLFSSYNHQEKPSFFVDTREELSKVMQNFVKTGKIEEPKKEAKQENVNVNVIEENNTL